LYNIVVRQNVHQHLYSCMLETTFFHLLTWVASDPELEVGELELSEVSSEH